MLLRSLAALIFVLQFVDAQRGRGRGGFPPPCHPNCPPRQWGRGPPPRGGNLGGQGGGFGGQGQGGNLGGQGGNFGGQGGNFGGQGQSGNLGGQGGGQGGFGGRGGKQSRDPSYYINNYATKVGDQIIAKDGNGRQCNRNQQRASSALGAAGLISRAKLAAQSGQCLRSGGGPPGGGGMRGGGGNRFGGGNNFGGGFGRRKKRQPGFGQCGQSSQQGTCDQGATRVESIYHHEIQGNMRLIVANGIPDHCYHSNQIHANPNGACENFAYIYAPTNVRVNQNSLNFKQTPMGPVGIAVSGAFLYNHKSAESCNVAAIQEKETFDTCDGHADPSCRYHYHKAPICITNWQRCGLMGYLLDGIPVYGECTLRENGQSVRLKSCYHLNSGSLGCDADRDYFWRQGSDCHLDKANGKFFAQRTLTDNPSVVFEAGTYAYFVTPEYPFLMPFYVGDRSYLCGVSKN